MKDILKKRLGTILGFITASVLIIIGLMTNQHLDVLKKAVKICLECVGIG